jgi:hypothetical protein
MAVTAEEILSAGTLAALPTDDVFMPDVTLERVVYNFPVPTFSRAMSSFPVMLSATGKADVDISLFPC